MLTNLLRQLKPAANTVRITASEDHASLWSMYMYGAVNNALDVVAEKCKALFVGTCFRLQSRRVHTELPGRYNIHKHTKKENISPEN